MRSNDILAKCTAKQWLEKKRAEWAKKGATFDFRQYDWYRRTYRRFYGNWESETPRYSHQRRYFCDQWPAGIRDLGDAHEVYKGIKHTGWYADHFYNELVRGRVLQLPSRDGTPVYIPGVYRTECDGVTLWPLDGYEDKDAAARAADGYAEREAEACREDNAMQEAEHSIDMHLGEIDVCRATVHALAKELREVGALPTAICSTLRGTIRSLRHEVTRHVKEIRKLRDDYWYAVQNW